MNRENYLKIVKYCEKRKCKVRTNSYGISWCVRCGKLHGTGIVSEPIKPEDQIIVK